MGEAQVHDQLVALLSHTVAHAVDVQLLLEALGDAHDHVVQQGAGQAVQAAVGLLVVGTGHMDHIALLGDGHGGMHLLRQGTLGALYGNQVTGFDLHVHTGGDGDRHSSDTRHILLSLLTRQTPGPRRRHGPRGRPCQS